MARIKRGKTSRRKHHKVLKLTKGFRMTKRKLIKVAKESQLHAGEYAFMGRKLRKRDLRRLWISRLNQSLQQMDLKYNQFIHALDKAEVKLDRKILAHLAIKDPKVFKIIVDKAREQLN